MADSNRPVQRAFVAALVVLAVAFAIGSWFAGHTAGAVEAQRLTRQVRSLEDELASVRLEKAVRVSNAVATGSGPDLSRTQFELQQCQAEANQYRSKLERAAPRKDSQLMEMLLTPGVNVHQLRGSASDENVLGYVFVLPHSKLVVLATHLPDPGANRQFQLWMIGEDSLNPVSAGLLTRPENDAPAYLEIDDPSVAIEPSDFVLTEEPMGGSNAPTGTKVLGSSD
jgi:hypothetical protein